MSEQRGFAGADPPERWPPTRGRPRPEELDRSLDTLPGVGPSQRGKLAKLGLRTVRDLLEHRPRDYQQAVGETPISNLFGEEEAVIAGEVRRISIRPTRRRLTVLKAAVRDESGEISAVWFNQPWLADKLQPGTRLRLRGQLRRNEFHVRSYDLDGAAATADFAPVYPASEEVTSPRLRTLVESALPHATDFGDSLPAGLRARERLPLRFDALVALHRPRDGGEAEWARRRLALDELLLLQVGLARIREGTEEATAPMLGEPGELAERYRQALPFELTKDQEQAIAEIDADLAASKPMQRLLQGDVGSGKTVVALYALLRAVEAGKTGALMAPTETLAEQHFLTLEPICTELGVRTALLTGSVKGDVEGAQILVGTHALIQEGVDLSELAVAVVDEQHRFGVEQRGALAAGRSPHVLHMTATPIPRTLALTVYGDLSVTEIAKPPANRKPIVTSWVTDERGPEAYRRLRKHLDAGRQAYVVCPLIEQSETSQARAAEAEAERLRRGELRDYRVGLLHGRLRPSERRQLMAHFKARELDVLVSTTVIEVGVDVPNATIMIVQEADRFGLAQLHQLRGRVGRGAEQSYCLLVSRAKEELTDNARERLQALVDTTDGFELAEKDLELRGEGQLLGTRQAGLSEFRFTRLRADRELLERARELAGELVVHEGPLNDEVDRFFAGAEADSLA
ncbi:MAG: ATP-dependent DNA helicase RecG [Actinobacteria bacterium 13_1_20CM_3_68_10]|nr:MAG: ATP-dependent DNA helicase RecG [Actinobacteria bacterium 13_1_20CM_3_68_10]